MLIHILLTIGFFLALLYLSTNLLGLLVRGLFVDPRLEELKSNEVEIIRKEAEKTQRAEVWVNIVALGLIVLYLYLLFHFWNWEVMGVAIVLMATRLPDLLWEIKHGKKITMETMPKNTLAYTTVILDWLMLPALYYFIYYI